MHHGNDALLNGPVCPLGNTILLRSIPGTVLSLDPLINAECLKFSRHVLPSLVISQGAQPLTSDVLCPSLELLESSKGF
jgi:hypothetical protein